MSQSILLKPKGLYTFFNHLEPEATPSGALLQATNAVIDRNEVIGSRRGYKIYGNAMDSQPSDTAHQLLEYKGRLLRHWGSGPGSFLDWDDGVGDFTTFSFSIIGDTHSNTTIDNIVSTENIVVGMIITGIGIPTNTLVVSVNSNNKITISQAATSSNTGLSLSFTYNVQEVDEGTRIKGIEVNGNLYFTTSNGIQKISIANASDFSSAFITPSGGIAALDMTAVLGTTGQGFLSGLSSCACRIVWGITDANNNEILGAPGSRLIVNNPTNTPENVTLTSSIPQGITKRSTEIS